MSAEIKNIKVENIHANPFRNMKINPLDPDKIDSLVRSFDTVGMWPSAIARPRRIGGYELAFAHNRLAAAKKLELKTIPLIVMDLSDEEMVKYMANENSEDFASKFLIMYDGFRAAWDWIEENDQTFEDEEHKGLAVARWLGWTTLMKQAGGKAYSVMTETARACEAVHALLPGGHIQLTQFRDLSINAAYTIAKAALDKLRLIQKEEAKGRITPSRAQAERSGVHEATKNTLSKARGGEIPSKRLGSAARQSITERTGYAPHAKPQKWFGDACRDAGAKIKNFAGWDKLAEDLAKIEANLERVTSADERRDLERLIEDIDACMTRLAEWSKKLGGRPKLAVVK